MFRGSGFRARVQGLGFRVESLVYLGFRGLGFDFLGGEPRCPRTWRHFT